MLMGKEELKAIIKEVIEEINIGYGIASNKEREQIDFATKVLSLILERIK